MAKKEKIIITDLPAFKAEPLPNPAKIINKLKHPVTISYNGVAMIIPPRGKEIVADKEKVGALPKGVFLVKV